MCKAVNNKMISIIVPVYNAGAYLQPLIDSVLSQTWHDLELILVDDGSTDGSAGICDAAADQDARVRVIHKENGGQSAARNAGLEVAQGQYIAFADHDDLLHPELYETLVNAMVTLGTDMAACGFRNVKQADMDSIVHDRAAIPAAMVTDRELIARYFTPAWHIPIWNKLYKRELIRDLRFSDFKLGEDNLFSYRVIKKAKRIAFIDKIMYYQRMHGENFEFTGYRHLDDLVRAKEIVLQDIRKSYPEQYPVCQKQFLYECIRIHNVFCQAPDVPDAKIDGVLEFIRRNADHILTAPMPRGHKLLFIRLKYGANRKKRKVISI